MSDVFRTVEEKYYRAELAYELSFNRLRALRWWVDEEAPDDTSKEVAEARSVHARAARAALAAASKAHQHAVTQVDLEDFSVIEAHLLDIVRTISLYYQES
jgi:DNA-directed RNA polymerase specialized sigma24 family protein